MIVKSLLAARGWTPLMWVGLSLVCATAFAGVDRSTWVGAIIAFLSSAGTAYLLAAAIVATFSDPD